MIYWDFSGFANFYWSLIQDFSKNATLLFFILKITTWLIVNQKIDKYNEKIKCDNERKIDVQEWKLSKQKKGLMEPDFIFLTLK